MDIEDLYADLLDRLDKIEDQLGLNQEKWDAMAANVVRQNKTNTALQEQITALQGKKRKAPEPDNDVAISRCSPRQRKAKVATPRRSLRLQKRQGK